MKYIIKTTSFLYMLGGGYGWFFCSHSFISIHARLIQNTYKYKISFFGRNIEEKNTSSKILIFLSVYEFACVSKDAWVNFFFYNSYTSWHSPITQNHVIIQASHKQMQNKKNILIMNSSYIGFVTTSV